MRGALPPVRLTEVGGLLRFARHRLASIGRQLRSGLDPRLARDMSADAISPAGEESKARIADDVRCGAQPGTASHCKRLCKPPVARCGSICQSPRHGAMMPPDLDPRQSEVAASRGLLILRFENLRVRVVRAGCENASCWHDYSNYRQIVIISKCQK